MGGKTIEAHPELVLGACGSWRPLDNVAPRSSKAGASGWAVNDLLLTIEQEGGTVNQRPQQVFSS